MFQVVLNDGKNEIPNDKVVYIIGKKIYLKKTVGLIESVTPLKEISFLNEMECYAKLNARKIPFSVFSRVLNFFKKVYIEHFSEAAILLYYNPDKKRYKICIPKQEVGAASVDYKVEKSFPGYVLMSSIHSHANFGAFHSGTDKNDEKDFDGLHITIGNVNSTDFSLAASVVINGSRFKYNPCDYIEGIECTTDDTDADWSKWTGARDGKRDLKYNLSYPEITCSDRWLRQVAKKATTVIYTGKFSSTDFNKNKDINYDEYSWLNFYGGGYEEFGSYLDTKFDTKPKEGDSKDEVKDDSVKRTYDPCQNCIFRDDHSRGVISFGERVY